MKDVANDNSSLLLILNIASLDIVCMPSASSSLFLSRASLRNLLAEYVKLRV